MNGVEYGQSRHIGDILKERNIELATKDPVVRGGFTQVPNFILRDGTLSLGAKVTYAMFLQYAWHNDSCFPGQERLAVDMGMSQSRVSEFIKELAAASLIEIKRRGMGKTNLYKIKFVVQKPPKNAKRQIS
jgi:Helix-turn-helix domain